jgi:hypothetical protein
LRFGTKKQKLKGRPDVFLRMYILFSYSLIKRKSLATHIIWLCRLPTRLRSSIEKRFVTPLSKESIFIPGRYSSSFVPVESQ